MCLSTSHRLSHEWGENLERRSVSIAVSLPPEVGVNRHGRRGSYLTKHRMEGIALCNRHRLHFKGITNNHSLATPPTTQLLTATRPHPISLYTRQITDRTTFDPRFRLLPCKERLSNLTAGNSTLMYRI